MTASASSRYILFNIKDHYQAVFLRDDTITLAAAEAHVTRERAAKHVAAVVVEAAAVVGAESVRWRGWRELETVGRQRC